MTLYSHKVSPQCLSHVRIGRLASGDKQASTAENEHLTHCDTCAGIMRRQQADVSAMALERVPATLVSASEAMAPKQHRAGVPWAAWAFLAAGVCVGVLLIPNALNQPRFTHIKGDVSLVLSIERNEVLVVDEVPIEKVGDVQVGDRLRVQVVNARGQFVQLDLCSEDRTCNVLYTGRLPDDDWIPAGLKIATPTPTVLRLRVAPDAASLPAREPLDFTLRAR